MHDSDTRRPEPLEPARPTPAREALPAPREPGPRGGSRPQPAAPGRRPGPRPRRPVPVRESTPPPARDLERARTPVEPTRKVDVDDETWTVRVKGAATVGTGNAGARILSVAFEGPGEQKNLDATRYVLARDLRDVGEDELVSLVREVARPPGDRPAKPGGGHMRGGGSRRRRGRT